MNDDQLFLANAYLDNDLSSEERARAEADPVVMTEVAQMRRVQDQLRAVPKPDTDRREAILGAALATYAPPPSAATDAEPAPVIAFPQRWSRVLQLAAAIVVVAALGVVVLRVLAGPMGSSDGDAVADGANDDRSVEMAEASDAEMDAMPKPEAAVASPDDMATDGAGDDLAAEPEPTGVVDDGSAAPRPLGYSDGTELTAVITDDAELASAAAEIAALAASGDLVIPTTTCPISDRTALATYVSPQTGDEVAVIVVVNDETIRLLDAADCDLLAEITALP
ncbi:MAG: hypothetical protein CSA55_05620 [Ilumatobacter coccineus]|uniref:Uncharacterized protein n=1 Tax=Ilumatobacter coccineus TaxID=467094 RepID=A0A2G6K9N2_9ACTN|nr:MAG: hypothetical protein CSA55_05620 [Ilumatobacter coccineus]